MVAPPRPGPGQRQSAGAPAASLQSALSGNETLAGLLERLAQSQARWAAVAALLPPELAAAARGGSLDDKAWVILADHAAAAAKLRQCLPDIERALQAQGWLAPPVKVKVRPRVG
ncbi:MAG: DciA family protein [Rubrivivax sp.]